uniref:Uncharacterized protein n=1 Tax=Acrobeloides nanus TaxID=290746 RepID=A0A914ES80_9BILA
MGCTCHQNSLSSPDLPPHELKLKKNTFVMLLGICEYVKAFAGKIITEGTKVVMSLSHELPWTQAKDSASRHQFPIKPAFAMTIDKAQGQTFDYVGVDLTREVLLSLPPKQPDKNIVDRVLRKEGQPGDMTNDVEDMEMDAEEMNDFAMP